MITYGCTPLPQGPGQPSSQPGMDLTWGGGVSLPTPVWRHVGVSRGDCGQKNCASSSMHSQKEIKADHEPE